MWCSSVDQERMRVSQYRTSRTSTPPRPSWLLSGATGEGMEQNGIMYQPCALSSSLHSHLRWVSVQRRHGHREPGQCPRHQAGRGWRIAFVTAGFRMKRGWPGEERDGRGKSSFVSNPAERCSVNWPRSALGPIAVVKRMMLLSRWTIGSFGRVFWLLVFCDVEARRQCSLSPPSPPLANDVIRPLGPGCS